MLDESELKVLMSSAIPPIRVEDATGPVALDQVRSLLLAFAAEFGPLTAEVFVAQGFQAEVTQLPGRYAPPGGCLLLAVDGGSPAGCVALRDLGGGTCEMKRLYVPPEFRARGAGRLLVAAILDRAAHLGYQRMVLDTLPEMTGAIALYRSFGFDLIDSYWGHPIAGAVFMARSLEAKPSA